MSEFNIYRDKFGFENDKRRREGSSEIIRRNSDRRSKETKKNNYYCEGPFQSQKQYSEDYKGRSGSYYNNPERYSVSSDSENDSSHNRDDDRKPKSSSFDDCKSPRVIKASISDSNIRNDQENDETESGDEDFSSARALTLKTKLILSQLGWKVNNLPDSDNKLLNVDSKLTENKLHEDEDLSFSEKPHKYNKTGEGCVEERRVRAGIQNTTQTGKLKDCENKVGSRPKECDNLYEDYSDFEEKMGESNCSKDEDSLIALNIKRCRSMVESKKGDVKDTFEGDCEEVRNVKVEPIPEKGKSKKRHCSERDLEENPFDVAGDVLTKSKRFKKSSRIKHDDRDDWKGENQSFRGDERRWIRVKERSHAKAKRCRSISISSYSDDSYDSYHQRRKRSKGRSLKKKHKKSFRDSYSWRDSEHKIKSRDLEIYDDTFKYDRSFNRWPKKKSHPVDLEEKVDSTEELGKEDVKKEKSKKKTHYDYFDEGSHWCDRCNVVYEEAVDYLRHLHFDSHQKSVRNDPKPWAEDLMEKSRMKSKSRISVPLKGLEFMLGTSAFYCKLCSELIADIKLAEKHMKSEDHNSNYRNFLQKNPRYQKRRTLDVESRMYQAVRVVHQEVLEPEIAPEVTVKEEVEAVDVPKVTRIEEEASETRPEVSNLGTVFEQELENKEEETIAKDPETPEKYQVGESFEKEHHAYDDSTKHAVVETVRQEPIVMELKSRPEKVTLDLKTTLETNSFKNIVQAKDKETSANSSSVLSSLKKLPFIGKRPSKMNLKSEAESGKPQITTNSASLSREELLSRVMKDTVTVQPKDIRIPPFPGVPPNAVMSGYMGGYVPMMASYVGYPSYGGYYDMSMYYDQSLFPTSASDAQTNKVVEAQVEDQPTSTGETLADVDSECNNLNQDHYENYTIGCDNASFDGTVNLEQAVDPISDALEVPGVTDKANLVLGKTSIDAENTLHSTFSPSQSESIAGFSSAEVPVQQDDI